MLDRLARFGFEPVIGVVPIDEALNSSFGQSADRHAECFLRCRDALARRKLRVPAGNQRLGLVVERAQQLALPAVPDARSNGADVGNGQHQQQLEAFRALHDIGEVADGLGVADVAAEGDRLMVRCCSISQADGLGLGGAHAQARAQLARDARACDANDPRRDPWRCRAGRPPRKARAGAARS